MKKIYLVLAVFFLTLSVSTTHALDTNKESTETNKVDTEASKSLKKQKEEKESAGKKKSKTVSKGLDKQTQDAIKEMGQVMESSNIDVSLSLEVVFADKLAELEKTAEPFASCQLITNPKLPQNFGITAEIRPGVIDTIRAGYFSNAAQSNSLIKNLADENAIVRYRNCLVFYGALIGQAYLNLNSDIADLKADVSKDKEGNIIIKGLGYDDFVSLADESLRKAIDNLNNKTIIRLYEKITNNDTPCRFEKSIEIIQCGNSQITLSAKPQLVSLGIPVYGSGFAGFQGSFKVSRGWSYSDAIEKLKSTSTYSKFADEVSKYAEELESQGKTKEATFVKKKAWELAESGKQNLSVSNLIPNIHQ